MARWIRRRMLPRDIDNKPERLTAAGTIGYWRFAEQSGSNYVQASAGSKTASVIILSDEDDQSVNTGARQKYASSDTSLISNPPIFVSGRTYSFAANETFRGTFSGVALVEAGATITAGEYIKVGSGGRAVPASLGAAVDVTAGGLTGGNLTSDQPGGDTVEIVSDSVDDSGQTIVVIGHLSGTVVTAEYVTDGTSVVTDAQTFTDVLGAYIKADSAPAVGTIDLREASGDQVFATISAGSRIIAGTLQIANSSTPGYTRELAISADGATTDYIIIEGRNAAGSLTREAVQLSGTDTVYTAAQFLTAERIYAGVVPSSVDVTVTTRSLEDDPEEIVGLALTSVEVGSRNVLGFLNTAAPSVEGDEYQLVSIDFQPYRTAYLGATYSHELGHNLGVRARTVTVTSAELLALNATPVELVPEPGPGRALIFEGAQLHYDYGTAAYAGVAAGEDLAFKYDGASGVQIGEVETTGFIDQTNDEYRWAYPAANTGAVLPSAVFTGNGPIMLHMLVGEVITGDGDLHVKVLYRVVDIDLS